MKTVMKKVLLLGNFGVGKTSLVRRFVENTFSDDYLTTIGVKISRKNVTLQEANIVVQMLIWDLEGKTATNTIPDTYLLGSAAAIIVADLTRLETLDSIPVHLDQFDKINPGKPVLVALNKADAASLPEERKAALLSLPGVIDVEMTSAKTGLNVEKVFELTAYEVASDA